MISFALPDSCNLKKQPIKNSFLRDKKPLRHPKNILALLSHAHAPLSSGISQFLVLEDTGFESGI